MQEDERAPWCGRARARFPIRILILGDAWIPLTHGVASTLASSSIHNSVVMTKFARLLPQPDPDSSRIVLRWHTLLRAIAVLNGLLWAFAAVAAMPAGILPRVQLLLAALYVFGCAYRCFLPVYDIPRIVLVDSRLSSIFVGRAVATIAELSFAAQWALTFHQMSFLTHNPVADAASLVIVPLIAVAEVCSWHAVLTTAQCGHVFENSIWGVAAALVTGSLLLIGPHQFVGLVRLMLIWSTAGSVYFVFIVFFDVPMYWSRWASDRSNGRQCLRLTAGVKDAWRRRVVSRRWEAWRSEVAWMTLYFTLGAWCSLSLVYASLDLRTVMR